MTQHMTSYDYMYDSDSPTPLHLFYLLFNTFLIGKWYCPCHNYLKDRFARARNHRDLDWLSIWKSVIKLTEKLVFISSHNEHDEPATLCLYWPYLFLTSHSRGFLIKMSNTQTEESASNIHQVQNKSIFCENIDPWRTEVRIRYRSGNKSFISKVYSPQLAILLYIYYNWK